MLYNQLQNGIFIIHENPEWIPPFREAFERAQVPFQEIILTEGAFFLDKEPPQGVFWSRLSASCHTRNNAFSKEYGRAILQWLEAYKRRVINGSNVLEFEISKIKQYLALNTAGFLTPKTYACFGKTHLLEVAKTFQTPFIVKHNQGGKGLGVRFFDEYENFKKYIGSDEFEMPIDGITLLQEYIKAKETFITRLEFIGGKFFYAVRVDTSDGSFELCPAESCEIETRKKTPKLAGGACDITSQFTLREDIHSQMPFVQQLENFLYKCNIEVAGVEVIETQENELVVYDINTNTNYNKAVEMSLRVKQGGAADRIVQFLCDELKKVKG
ncbi:alpha-L-glutamate ligase [Campylobacter sp. MIT 21-1685]|uniref:ATP-grasp domain-containing protein n=1 Tax=unclassified Campylobacter TaxID=2593542 RepID=UPI00224A64BE|nr:MULTISPECIES: alpha-L-glutamate ligase [unclassified Campylobacter]MCX2682527.1 alpha-L-glutamate ligase [Campylobacter sp. MIT 21-1684]MCX2750760.1 alpha-L-glutamate ligase [Campylobacter sp. MIT 21-1682]MCX2807008.1 alpha-L-glutamate ligase [Campylobacter sp. MIT 21-1685]